VPPLRYRTPRRMGRAPTTVEQLPELEIGAARRRRTVFDKLHVAVGEGTRAMRRSEDRVRIDQRPGAKRRQWRFRAEDNRLCRNDAKLLPRISNRGDRNSHRIAPDIRHPCHPLGRPFCQNQTAVDVGDGIPAIPARRCLTKWIRRHGAHIPGSHQCHRQTRPDGTPWPTLRCWH
jgi:hypothetical protein